MPFICGGHPHPGLLGTILPALERGGASIVEIGIPFSDPIADGPVIAAAMHEALSAGATPLGIFQEVAEVRARVSIGIVAMCSASIVHRMGGPGAFARLASKAGFDGLIVPDVPLEESADIRHAAKDEGMTCSLLVSPNSPAERAGAILHASTGFVYLMARSGITGEQRAAPSIAPAVEMLRAAGDLPIACGFGISSAAHVRAVVQDGGADAAIVGSALVKELASAARRGDDPARFAETYTRSLTP